jgi:F-type H+-transporting ATPase subunit epsilon
MALTLEIITPDRKVLETAAEQVVLPTESGESGILPGHVPLITKLVPGEIQVIHSESTEHIAVGKGYAKVLGDAISILAEDAIDVSEIDLSAVESAQVRAEAALEKARAEGVDPDELERLTSGVRYLVAQKLAKGRRR